MADRVTQKWLDARIKLLSELSGMPLSLESNNPGDYRRYKVTNPGGSHNYSPGLKAGEIDIWLSGAIAAFRELVFVGRKSNPKRHGKNPIKGPGKFEGETYAGKFAFENPDEETGESDALGWYGKFSGKIKGRGPFHIITSEDSQGFVRAEFFDTVAQLEKAWRGIEKEYAEYYSENDS